LVPKGNLHDNLHKEETLPWETRSIRHTMAYICTLLQLNMSYSLHLKL
jgi:hypothetical protein